MWKGLKVIGIINVIFILLQIILHTIYLLGTILHIEAITKNFELERDTIGVVIIFWILATLLNLILLYYNFGLINQNTSNFLRDWLIIHGVVMFICLLDNAWRLNRAEYISSNFMVAVLLIEIIIIIIFCYIIPSTSGSNTGNQSANV